MSLPTSQQLSKKHSKLNKYKLEGLQFEQRVFEALCKSSWPGEVERDVWFHYFAEDGYA